MQDWVSRRSGDLETRTVETGFRVAATPSRHISNGAIVPIRRLVSEETNLASHDLSDPGFLASAVAYASRAPENEGGAINGRSAGSHRANGYVMAPPTAQSAAGKGLARFLRRP
ncbi:hypothetical protein ASF32_14435 [Methylobacterium sp. Leaf91]|nr:hypothetical protein ASF24_04295 [Methylobacterium sp. Leaf86]KQO99050.1 hypothetical protein ASF32_14435 [Methylobacterium sp. Leaf91]